MGLGQPELGWPHRLNHRDPVRIGHLPGGHPGHHSRDRRTTMTKALGVWTADDCALVLIDYQNEMFEVIRSETPADLVERNVRLLARTARALELPIVLSTV